MKINLQSVHFDADRKLIDFVDSKMGKLSSVYDTILETDVTLRIDKASDNQNKIAEIRLHVSGNDLFAKRQCKTFEEAVDQCSEALRNQLAKHKDKLKSV
jgi:putative sigma-54 modulation protein